jgi:FCD domain
MSSVEALRRRWEAEILAAAHRLRGCPKSNGESSSDDWYRDNRAFHDALVSACHSPQMMALHVQLYDLSDRYRRLSVRNGLAGRDFDAEHQLIMDAVLARDADAAVAYTMDHFIETTRVILSGELESKYDVERIIAALRSNTDPALVPPRRTMRERRLVPAESREKIGPTGTSRAVGRFKICRSRPLSATP